MRVTECTLISVFNRIKLFTVVHGPYLDESSRRAESESKEHFVRKAHLSGHFSIKKCCFSLKQKSQNCVEIKFQCNIWGQLDVRTRMRDSKSQIFYLKKTNLWGLSVH